MDAVASSSSDGLYINPDSSLFDAHQYLFDVILYIDEAHHASTMILAIVGVVFNLLLMAVVACSKELHHRRILIWLGIGVSNVLVLSSHVLVSQSVVWGSSSSERSLCYWFVILCLFVQMFNVVFAALERHICINYPALYKTAAFSTISITIVQLTSYIPVFIVLVILNVNNFQELSPPLAFESINFKLVVIFFFGFLLFCLCGQMILTKIKKNRGEIVIETLNHRLNNFNNHKPGHQTTGKNSVAVLVGKREFSQQDCKAAQNFYFSVKMHFIFMTVKLIPFIRILICLDHHILSSENQQEPWPEAECSFVIKEFYFASAFLDCFYSSIANPAAFLYFTLIKEDRPNNPE